MARLARSADLAPDVPVPPRFPRFPRSGVARLPAALSTVRSTARSTVRLAAAGALVGLGTAVWVAVASPPAAADPMASCTTTTGVVVAVDFSHWGGNVERGCAAAPATGYDALVAAGFTPAGDQQSGPAFICRIDDEPPPSEDPCVTTPPATAYWSYWHADAGQSTWSESPVGAMSYQPPPGSVDGWAFGAGQPPSVPPSAVRATTPGPTPTTTTAAPTAGSPPPSSSGSGTAPSPTGAGTGAGGGASTGTAGSGGSATGSAGTPPPAPSGPSPAQGQGQGGSVGGTGTPPSSGRSGGPSTTSSTTGAGPGAAVPPGGTSAGHPRVVDVSPASNRPKAPSGSPLPAVLGSVVAIGLGGTGGLVAWRRRAGSQ